MRSRRLLTASLTALGLLAAAPAAASACAGADARPAAADAAELRAAVVCLTNGERAAAGLRPLAADPHLEAASQAYAARMVAERFFAHVAPDGSELAGRVRAYVDWTTLGENLAWGGGDRATPRATVAGWMASPGHRRNILSAAYEDVGIGVVAGSPEGDWTTAATYVASYGARAGEDPQALPPVAAPPAAAPSVVVAATAARRPVTRPVSRRVAAHRAAVRRIAARRAAVQRAAARRAAARRAAVQRGTARRATARGPRWCRRPATRRVFRLHGRLVARCVRVAAPRR